MERVSLFLDLLVRTAQPRVEQTITIKKTQHYVVCIFAVLKKGNATVFVRLKEDGIPV